MHLKTQWGMSPYVVVAVLADIVQILLGLVSLAPNTTYTLHSGAGGSYIVLATGTDALRESQHDDPEQWLCEGNTFWVSTARFRLAISVLPAVPRKMGLNWFMPALVKSSVGSL